MEANPRAGGSPGTPSAMKAEPGARYPSSPVFRPCMTDVVTSSLVRFEALVCGY